MSDHLQPWIEPELEARIVALVLGEASDFEREELERLIEERPELALFRERIEKVHGLLGEYAAEGEQPEAEDEETWRMSDERRQALLTTLQGEPGSAASGATEKDPDEARHPQPGHGSSDGRSGRIILLFSRFAAAACLMLALGWGVKAFGPQGGGGGGDDTVALYENDRWGAADGESLYSVAPGHGQVAPITPSPERDDLKLTNQEHDYAEIGHGAYLYSGTTDQPTSSTAQSSLSAIEGNISALGDIEITATTTAPSSGPAMEMAKLEQRNYRVLNESGELAQVLDERVVTEEKRDQALSAGNGVATADEKGGQEQLGFMTGDSNVSTELKNGTVSEEVTQELWRDESDKEVNTRGAGGNQNQNAPAMDGLYVEEEPAEPADNAGMDAEDDVIHGGVSISVDFGDEDEEMALGLTEDATESPATFGRSASAGKDFAQSAEDGAMIGHGGRNSGSGGDPFGGLGGGDGGGGADSTLHPRMSPSQDRFFSSGGTIDSSGLASGGIVLTEPAPVDAKPKPAPAQQVQRQEAKSNGSNRGRADFGEVTSEEGGLGLGGYVDVTDMAPPPNESFDAQPVRKPVPTPGAAPAMPATATDQYGTEYLPEVPMPTTAAPSTSVPAPPRKESSTEAYLRPQISTEAEELPAMELQEQQPTSGEFDGFYYLAPEAQAPAPKAANKQRASKLERDFDRSDAQSGRSMATNSLAEQLPNLEAESLAKKAAPRKPEVSQELGAIEKETEQIEQQISQLELLQDKRRVLATDALLSPESSDKMLEDAEKTQMQLADLQDQLAPLQQKQKALSIAAEADTRQLKREEVLAEKQAALAEMNTLKLKLTESRLLEDQLGDKARVGRELQQLRDTAAKAEREGDSARARELREKAQTIETNLRKQAEASKDNAEARQKVTERLVELGDQVELRDKQLETLARRKAGLESRSDKVSSIVIPEIEFENTPLSDAVEFLHIKSRDLDDIEPDPERKGVDVILRNLGGETAVLADKRVSLRLTDVPLLDAAAALADAAGLDYQVTPEAIVVFSDSEVESQPQARAVPSNLEELSAADEPFSTFSLHVSDVSFKLAQDALAKGEWPDAARIRVEEFVNAFDYGDPMPSQQEKVACALEQAVHPFLQQRNLLRISMRTAAKGRAQDTPLRLTVLLDNSGSMERPDRQQSVQRAFWLLANQLQPSDQVSLIGFARTPRLLAQTKGQASRQLTEIVATTPSQGGTNLEQALTLAWEKAKEEKLEGAQNRIVLLTDGAANLGDADPDRLSAMVEQMRQDGIAFDAAGVGAEGLNDEILEALTRKGDGRYYVLNKPEDADEGFAKQIAGALRPAAMNVKVQVEFNPDRVGNYKLLGFEKHRLEKEDFRNDAVDAAEMAAEEAGVAVYQVEPLPGGEGDIGYVSVRFKDMSTGAMVERRWPIPYEPNTARLRQAAPSMRIATVASLFASKLKGDPLGETVSLRELSRVMAELPAQQQSMERVKELRQMIDQARFLTGQ